MMDLKLFDRRVRFVFTDRSWGSYHIKAEGLEYRLAKLMDFLAVKTILSAPLDFTNIIGRDSDPVITPYSNGFFRLKDKADGLLTAKTGLALMISSADCFSGILYEPQTRQLCLVHLGLENLFRPDGSPSTLETAVRAMGETPDRPLFWFGAGIQRCCYGVADKTLAGAVKERFGKEVSDDVVKFGPRRGYPLIDLHLVILEEARRLDLNVFQSLEAVICTSCHGLKQPNGDGSGLYYSHVRNFSPSAEKKRSAAIALLP